MSSHVTAVVFSPGAAALPATARAGAQVREHRRDSQSLQTREKLADVKQRHDVYDP